MDFYRPQPGWTTFLFKLSLAIAVMGLFLYFTMGHHAQWLAYGIALRALHLSGLVAGGAGMYFLCLWLLGLRLSQFTRRSA
jgi:putative peptidoglycan lipid II flippase